MSPDDVFAAQMWSWPDPMLKRDSAGRVLYVNAAFLALYGGRVENWAGNPVMGWPAPNTSGQPYRFETRGGVAPNEIIYDWVEVMMADGNAMAIARDVTVFQQAPMAPPIQAAIPPVDLAVSTPPASETPVQPPALEPAIAPPAPEVIAVAPPVQEIKPAPTQAPAATQIPPQPAAQHETLEIQTPIIDAPQIDVPEINVPDIQVTDILMPQSAAPESLPIVTPAAPAAPQIVEQEIAAIAEPATPATEAVTQVQIQAPIEVPEDATAQTPERDFERRALPIENDEAVLGSNWRDAVIARAVGGAVATPEEEVPSEPETVTASQAESSETAPLRILLAEDNAINALLTRTLLEADGCIVETVEDGALAVEAVKSNEYDLILMDMRMPNMDGLDATRKIRAMGGRRADALPIIALTANAFDDDRNACFDSGMNDFMTKPVSAEELTAMVTNWVNKTREKAAQKLAS